MQFSLNFMIFFPPHNFAQCAICMPQPLFAAFRIQISSIFFVFPGTVSSTALQRMHPCLPRRRVPPRLRTTLFPPKMLRRSTFSMQQTGKCRPLSKKSTTRLLAGKPFLSFSTNHITFSSCFCCRELKKHCKSCCIC